MACAVYEETTPGKEYTGSAGPEVGDRGQGGSGAWQEGKKDEIKCRQRGEAGKKGPEGREEMDSRDKEEREKEGNKARINEQIPLLSIGSVRCSGSQSHIVIAVFLRAPSETKYVTGRPIFY